MRNKFWWLLPLVSSLSGLILIGIFLYQPVTIIENNSAVTIRYPALTVNSLLRVSGISFYSGDIVSPGLQSLLLDNRPIKVQNTSTIALWIDGQRILVFSTEKYPANLLFQYGVRLFPGDILTVDGKQSSTSDTFQLIRYHTVQYKKWQPDITPSGNEAESLPNNIGSQLAHKKQPLMGLDYSVPSEEQPLSNEPVQIQRVSDSFLLEQKVLPFSYQTQADNQVELDQQVVTQTGEYGLAVDFTRIRAVNGLEASRTTISSTIIRSPRDQILSYGTKASVKQLDIGGTTIDYWRSVSMYATSYSPCRLGIPGCSSATASGAKVAKGIVAVVYRWFVNMRGQQVYIPGYGFATIADTGGGIPGTPWIDLGYSDEDYEQWAQWVTVYFLAPIPANILYVLN
jgi:resuscitation-promoting factor RpfB